MKDSDIIKKLLGDDFTQQVILELGLSNDPLDVQAELIASVGETIMQRVVLEIVKKLPDVFAKKFENLIGAGDMQAIRALVTLYIPNLDEFIAAEARKEYAIIRDRMREVSGVTY